MNDKEWATLIDDLRNLDDIPAASRATKRLHKESKHEDVPRLLKLLEHEIFFVREAAAWPLTELAGAEHLPELFRAYQRGIDDGHDNDGFSAALADMAEMNPTAVRKALEPLLKSSDAKVQSLASWLQEFCGPGT